MTSHELIADGPAAAPRASEAIYEEIKHKILRGEITPGDRLPSERQLMDMLHRSRPTIREALRMLERDGFIKISAGTNGASVVKYEPTNIEQPLETMLQVSDIAIGELYEFRMQVECAIAEWAALRRGEEDLHLLEETISMARGYLESGAFDRFLASDTVFHGQLAKASRNEVACIINGVFHNITERFLKPLFTNKTEDELRRRCESISNGHQRIFEAVRGGSVEKAREAMTYHLDTFSSEFK